MVIGQWNGTTAAKPPAPMPAAASASGRTQHAAADKSAPAPATVPTAATPRSGSSKAAGRVKTSLFKTRLRTIGIFCATCSGYRIKENHHGGARSVPPGSLLRQPHLAPARCQRLLWVESRQLPTLQFAAVYERRQSPLTIGMPSNGIKQVARSRRRLWGGSCHD